MKQARIKLADGGKKPVYKTAGASCADCFARIPSGYFTLPEGTRCLVNIGFCIELPEGYEAVIRPRSGLSKIGIDIAYGCIDSDYRGEGKACVINNSSGDYTINDGDRICQMKIQETGQFDFAEADELSMTERGASGFGSTGV